MWKISQTIRKNSKRQISKDEVKEQEAAKHSECVLIIRFHFTAELYTTLGVLQILNKHLFN